MRYLMGIDNGGTVVKAALFDEDGHQIAVSAKTTALLTPKSGYTERDMDLLWQSNVSVIREVLRESGIDPSDIAGISFSGHGKGLYLVGKEGRPAYNGILSTDMRAWKYVEYWRGAGIDRKVYEKTFQKILPYQPVSLLAWLKEKEPEVYRKIRYIFSVKDYIRFRMTGEAALEYTDASGGNLLNFKTGGYDPDLFKLFGIEEIYEKLPPLKNAVELSGFVTEEAAKETGLKAGTPTAAGMFDIDACGLAGGLIHEEKLSMIAGTWSINEYIRKNPITDKSVALNSMYCIPGYYLIEESSPTSAGNLQWFIDGMMKEEKEALSREGKSVYPLVNSLVEAVDPKISNLVFLPFLNGSGGETPAKGAFIGMTGYHGKKEMLRAIYEGVVFSHLTHLNRLLKNRERPESIQLSGGATGSDVWCKLFADILQIPIDVVEKKEMGAQGAAMAAGIATGVYQDFEDAVRKVVRIDKTIPHRPEMKEIYEKKYETYLKVAASLESVWERFQG